MTVSQSQKFFGYMRYRTSVGPQNAIPYPLRI
jgi:hypothetical protein